MVIYGTCENITRSYSIIEDPVFNCLLLSSALVVGIIILIIMLVLIFKAIKNKRKDPNPKEELKDDNEEETNKNDLEDLENEEKVAEEENKQKEEVENKEKHKEKGNNNIKEILKETEFVTDDVEFKENQEVENKVLKSLDNFEEEDYKLDIKSKIQDNYLTLTPTVKEVNKENVFTKDDITFTLKVYHNDVKVGELNNLEDSIEIQLNYNDKNNIKVYNLDKTIYEIKDVQVKNEPKVNIIGKSYVDQHDEFILNISDYENISWSTTEGIDIVKGQGTNKIIVKYTQTGKQKINVTVRIKPDLEVKDVFELNITEKTETKNLTAKDLDTEEKEKNNEKQDNKKLKETGSFKAKSPGTPITTSDTVKVNFKNVYQEIKNETIKDKENGQTPPYNINKWIKDEEKNIIGAEFWIYLGSEPTEKDFIYEIE